MFQVEPMLWLQALASAPLTWLLSAVTLLGYAPAYGAAVLWLAFGVHLRRGLAVMMAVLACGVLTEAMKNGFALPRPSDVDARVRTPSIVLVAQPPGPAVPEGTRAGAASFWSLPAPEAIAAVRARPRPSYGFPSGHVATALAFVLAAGLLFGSRRTAALALPWALVMALSRMYLGRHFLADVLGGLLVGVTAVIATRLLLGPEARAGASVESRRRSWPLLLTSALLLLLLPVARPLDPGYVGALVGAAASYSLLSRREGFAPDAGSTAQRAARVVAAAVLLLLARRIAVSVFEALSWEEVRLASGMAHAAAVLLAFVGTVALARRLGWYGRGPMPARPDLSRG